jgi:hypothetical protein
MKTFTRWLLVLLLVAIPMMAVVQTASANSELVPASRLIAPYVTNSTSATAPVAGQATFLLLSNVTWTGGPNTAVNVHLEFYDKTCVRTDRTIVLSIGDTDQFNVTNTITMASGHGWVDIDARSGAGGLGDPSVQQNQLVGQVLIADTSNDYAFSYPMAASVGSTATGVGGVAATIVTRNSSGNAVTWTGRYEPFPTRLILPAYFAEQTAAPAIVGFLAVASPADGNWYGQGAASTICTTATGCGEAPGEDLAGTGNLITSGTQVWDGCEHAASFPQSGHYVSGTLGGTVAVNNFGIGTLGNRTAWAPLGTGTCTSGPSGFPQPDRDLSGEPVGWIDFPNTSVVKRGLAITGTARARGMVGVFFETSLGTGKLGDASRLWGDRASINSQVGCRSSANAAILPLATAAGQCTYNIVAPDGTPTPQP